MRPFLKWAGGKARLVPRIAAQLPPGERLVEPFVGSAAVWLGTSYAEALLADSNPDLIACYTMLKRRGEAFIAACREYFRAENNDATRYYALRDRFNATRDVEERAALFVYLNRHGYNGLCRYNAGGGFNVPFGRYARPYFPEAEMRAFLRKADGATFITADFRTVMRAAQVGDVVYCDPPYVPLTDTARFTAYAAGGFGSEDQRDLAALAKDLAARGIPVLISNHRTPFTEAIYAGARIERFGVRRAISCDGSRRAIVDELLARFGAP